MPCTSTTSSQRATTRRTWTPSTASTWARPTGLVVKPSKLVRATADGVECLGLEVDGHEHRIGVSACKLQRLCDRTNALLDGGRCTGRELSSLVGEWTWACLVRRPALAVLSTVYRFEDVASRRALWLWPSVRQELSTLVGLAPLLSADLGAPWFPRVVASDASSWGQGVVAARADPAACNVADLAQYEWRTVVSSSWDRPEHINVLEVRALTTAVRWALSHPTSVGRRAMVLSDSQVAVGAVRKGRSSSRSLLVRLRALSALLLAGGVQLDAVWIPSESNPADGPSRRGQGEAGGP